jgi:hypothetical protein
MIAVAGLAFAAAAQAQIAVVNNNNPATIASVIAGGPSGITINSLNLAGQSSGTSRSTGIFNVVGPNGYGLGGTGIVMSTGNAATYASGSNTSTSRSLNYLTGGTGSASAPGVAATSAQNTLLSSITGRPDHFDVTQIDINFTPDVGITTVGFDLVFGSEEWAEFVGSNFNDGFGIFLNGVNIANFSGQPISINNTAMSGLVETELDGVITTGSGIAVFQVFGNVNPGPNTLTFILGDAADGVYDTTVYIQNFGIPTPGALCLLGLGGLVSTRRRRA